MGHYLKGHQAWTSKGACSIATTGRCKLSLKDCGRGTVRPELGPQIRSLHLHHDVGMSGAEATLLCHAGM